IDCVQSDVSEGSMVIELPSNEMSSVSVWYWTTPCSLATLPVLTTCWTGAQRLTLLPLLLNVNDGEAAPLVMRLSENSWLTGDGSSKGSSKKKPSSVMKPSPSTIKTGCDRAGTAETASTPTNESTNIIRFDRLIRLNTLPPLLIDLDGC